MTSYPQSSHSWTLLSDLIAVKLLDKSSFLHHGTGIPREFVPHFTEAPVALNGTPIVLKYEDREYPAHLKYDALNQRVRLFWMSDFVELLKHNFPQVHRIYAANGVVDSPPLVVLNTTGEHVFAVSFIEAPSSADDWSDIELEAAVIAYFTMLRKEKDGVRYSKAEMNRQLREVVLSRRNKQSIEYRMANISSVLEELCYPTIKGYKSRGHIGAGVSSRIKKAIEAHHLFSLKDYQPTADQVELDKRTRSIRKNGLEGKPKGQKKPKKISSSCSGYERDPTVRAWVLENARGTCELCLNPAPFMGKDTEPFLEVHHVKYLSDEGEDTIENAVALCPNCHREAHYSGKVGEVTDRIREAVPRIVSQHIS